MWLLDWLNGLLVGGDWLMGWLGECWLPGWVLVWLVWHVGCLAGGLAGCVVAWFVAGLGWLVMDVWLSS